MTSQERADKTATAVVEIVCDELQSYTTEQFMVERVAAILKQAFKDHAADIRRKINATD